MTLKQYQTLTTVVTLTLYNLEGQRLFKRMLGNKGERSKRHKLYLELLVELEEDNINSDNINRLLKKLDLPELKRYNDFEDELNDLI